MHRLASALGPGREFDLIRRLTGGDIAEPPGVARGPGDDAAVLEGGWVLSCDLSIEDVHFRRAWLSPEAIGGRAIRGALSDLAAMAAEPVGVLLSIAGSDADLADGTLEALGRGARDTAELLGAPVLGGDISRSPGPLVIDAMVVGRTPAPIGRDSARPGDELWVTGTLGAAAAAVQLLDAESGMPASALPDRLHDAFACPRPRLAEALALAATRCLTALIDLSDGIAGDAAHLAAASGVALEIDVERIPIDAAAAARLGPEAALELAVGGGEDYELLFSATPGLHAHAAAFASAHAAAFFGPALSCIGRVVEGPPGVRFVRDGKDWTPPSAFDHFASSLPPRPVTDR